MIYFVSFLCGAFGRRIAGGLFETWTGFKWGQVTRIFMGIMLTVPLVWVDVHYLWCLAFLFVLWVGSTLPLFSSLGMGRQGIPEHPKLTDPVYIRDAAFMTLHGIVNTIMPAAIMWYLGYGWYWVVLSGFLYAPAYELGYRIVGVNPQPNPFNRMNWPTGFNGSPEYGELLTGGIRGLAIALAVTL